MSNETVKFRINAMVESSTELEMNESIEQFENRLVDIYLHNSDSSDKSDLGVNECTIEVVEGFSKVVQPSKVKGAKIRYIFDCTEKQATNLQSLLSLAGEHRPQPLVIPLKPQAEREECSAWRFVEDHYPDYHRCDSIAYNDDLTKLINDEHEPEDCASLTLQCDYGDDLDNPEIQNDLNRSSVDIYERAINGFLNDEEKRFPNGFDSWQETHFEMVKNIIEQDSNPSDRVELVQEMEGTGGLYELAKELTDKFELQNKGKQWGVDDDTQYFDAIEDFLNVEFWKNKGGK